MASSNVALGLDWVEAMNNNRWTFAPRFELGTGVSSGPVVRWPRVNWWSGGEPSQFPFAEKRAQYGDTKGYRTVSYAAATDLAALLPFELQTLVLGSTSAWGVQDRELILPGGRSRTSGRPGSSGPPSGGDDTSELGELIGDSLTFRMTQVTGLCHHCGEGKDTAQQKCYVTSCASSLARVFQQFWTKLKKYVICNYALQYLITLYLFCFIGIVYLSLLLLIHARHSEQ